MLYTKGCTENTGTTITLVDSWTPVNVRSISPINGSILVRNADYTVVCVYPNDRIRFEESEAVCYEMKGTRPSVECDVVLFK